MTKLMAGASREDITPPAGTPLMGYAPARAAESVGDCLRVTAVALGWGDVRALLIGCDLCVLDNGLCGRLRARIAGETGVPAENIILGATHTHSGPAARGLAGGADYDEAYCSGIFEPRALKAAREAVERLTPAEMGVGTVESDVGVNRRELDRAGNVLLGQNPWGCRDPVMTVVSFRSPGGAPIANVVHYGAHCTAAGKNPEITRDWAGVMVDRLEAESGAVTAFLNGALGDCGPRLPNGKTVGDLALARELGGRAAVDAVRAWRSIKEYREERLAVACGPLCLPYEPIGAPEAIRAQIERLGDPASLAGMKVMEHEALSRRLEESLSGRPRQTSLELSQNIVSTGPVAFVPFPFEMFSEITLRIRRFSPFGHTLCLSNANGSRFYFPSRDQIARGGYEVWVFKSMNVYALADGADDAAVEGSLRLLESLHAAR